MILFSCCIFLEKSWVHNTTQQLLVLGTQHQLMKLWMLVVGYTTTNCTKVGCWVHNNQQISDVVLCCVGSCWYNPCLVSPYQMDFGSWEGGILSSPRWGEVEKSTPLLANQLRVVGLVRLPLKNLFSTTLMFTGRLLQPSDQWPQIQCLPWQRNGKEIRWTSGEWKRILVFRWKEGHLLRAMASRWKRGVGNRN